jgi:SAM-dependent methyltransferase
MSEAARHDAWQAGDSYDSYMGRWSRQIAPRFLDWLNAPADLDWLEVGCGAGALSAAILDGCGPNSLVCVEPSEGFLARARINVSGARVEFRQGDAQVLPLEAESRDIAVSALVLNFVPDREKALTEMRRVLRPGGTIAFYVWDYPGGGVEFMRAFWTAAVALDPAARDLTEDRRFPFCTPEGLATLVERTGTGSADCAPIEAMSVFRDFDDFWRPFTLGAGPAPGYCMSLAPEARERLRRKLEQSLPRADDGTIPMRLRAWAVRASA